MAPAYGIAIVIIFFIRAVRIEIRSKGNKYYIDSLSLSKGRELIDVIINHPKFAGEKKSNKQIIQKIFFAVFILFWIIMLCGTYLKDNTESLKDSDADTNGTVIENTLSDTSNMDAYGVTAKFISKMSQTEKERSEKY